jgi:hypothetical protein
MSSRPLLTPDQIITSGNMSASSITSDVTIINRLSMVSYEISWTGTSPVGVITVEVSNSYRQNADGSVAVAGTWNALALGTLSVSGNSGSMFLDIVQTGAYAIRVKYTKTSGIGTMNAYICGKVA